MSLQRLRMNLQIDNNWYWPKAQEIVHAKQHLAVLEKNRLNLIIVSLIALLAIIPALQDEHTAYGQGSERCVLSTPIRIVNEYYSTYNVTIGQPVRVAGELHSLYIKPVTVEPIPIVDRNRIYSVIPEEKRCERIPASIKDDIVANEWQIVNASFPIIETGNGSQFSLEPGQRIPFAFDMETTHAGKYILSQGFVFTFDSGNSTESIITIGYGQPVIVRPSPEQLQECKELGITSDKCNDTEILEHKCLGPSCNVESRPAVVFDMSLVLIIIGVGAAAVAGVWLGSNMKHSK